MDVAEFLFVCWAGGEDEAGFFLGAVGSSEGFVATLEGVSGLGVFCCGFGGVF